jgi:hypothetical protein
MISRIWHGWTTHENAAAYQSLLETEILPGIANRQMKGYKGAHLLRRDLERVLKVEIQALKGLNSIAVGETHGTVANEVRP